MSPTWSVDLGNEDIQHQCLCVTNEAAWWVSTTGVLYTWQGSSYNKSNVYDEVPDPIALLQLDNRAYFMKVSTSNTIVILTAHYMSLYSIIRGNAPLFLRNSYKYNQYDGGNVEELWSVEEDDSEQTEVVVAVEETQRLPCRVPNDVCAGDVNCDVTCGAFCSSTGLYVVNCIPPLSDDTMSNSNSCVDRYECTLLGASTRGCRFVCFSGVTQLVLLDEVNHLLLLRCEGREQQHSTKSRSNGPFSSFGSSSVVELLVNGHVLTRTASVTALVCSHSALSTPIVLIGLSTGQVRLVDGESLHQLRTWDVSSVLLHRQLSGETAGPSRCLRQESQSSRAQRDSLKTPTQLGDTPQPTRLSLQLPVLDVQIGEYLFTISTPQGVLYYNRHTFQLQETYTFRYDPPLVRLDEGATQAAEDQILFRSASNGSWCYTKAFEKTLHYAPTNVDTLHSVGQREAEEQLASTDLIHARVPLPSTWISTDDGLPRHKKSPASAVSSKGAATPARRPAKGSGYGDAPWSVQQQRKLKAQAVAAQDRRAQDFGLPPASRTKSIRFQYSLNDITAHLNPSAFHQMEAPTKALRHLHTRAVLATTFDTTGDALVTGSSDGSAQHLQYPVARSKRTGDVVGRVLAGHSAGVTAVDTNLSRQSRLVLTGCADGKLRLWTPGGQDTPVAECTTGARGEKSTDGANAVTCAQFFYLDKFLLSCTKDLLELRRHGTSATTIASSLTTNAQAPPARLVSAPVYRHSVGDGHTITTATGINCFASNIVVLATSDKELRVLDVVTDTVLWRNSATHTRNIYRVALGRTSRYAASMANSAAHLFASAALDSTVALWDVRVRLPVQLYTQHTNSAISSLGLELSPGNAMVAVASQDSRAYLYDIRKGGSATAFAVLQGFETYVTSIAWHPLKPIVAAGLANGDVQLFECMSS